MLKRQRQIKRPAKWKFIFAGYLGNFKKNAMAKQI